MAQMSISVARSPFSRSVVHAKEHQGQNPGEGATQVSTSSLPRIFPGPLTASFNDQHCPQAGKDSGSGSSSIPLPDGGSGKFVGGCTNPLARTAEHPSPPLSDDNSRTPPFILFQIRPPVMVITSSDTIDNVVRRAVSNLHG